MKLARFVAHYIYQNGLSQNEVNLLNHKLPIIAHAVLYFVFGVVSGLWVQLGRNNLKRFNLALSASGTCGAVRFIDEWLKQFVPGRHFHMQDFFMNVASALTGLLACCLVGHAVRMLCRQKEQDKTGE